MTHDPMVALNSETVIRIQRASVAERYKLNSYPRLLYADWKHF